MLSADQASSYLSGQAAGAGFVLGGVTAFGVNGVLAQVPEALAAPSETAIATVHAEGAQIYECKMDNDGKLTWTIREPVATLLLNGKTVGRHPSGPPLNPR